MQLSTPMAAAEILEVARQRADAAGDHWGAADIAQKIGYSYLYINRYDEALRWLDQVADAGFNGSNPFFEAWHYNARTCMARRTGAADWADDAVRAVAAADDCGELLTIGWAVGYQVEERLRAGDVEGALAVATTRRADLVARGASTVTLGFIDMALVKAAASWGGDWDAADALESLLALYADEKIAVGEEWELEDVVISDLMRGRDATAPIARMAELALQLEDPCFSGLASMFTAIAALQAGDPARGADAVRRALADWQGRGYAIHEVQALDVLAWASAAGGDPTTAGRFHAIAAHERADRGWATSLAEAAWHTAAEEHTPDRDAFAAGAQGADGLTLDDAITQALRSRGARLRPDSGWPSLTPTELEVVALVGDGLSNPEIAERLFMSRSTVKTHLNHVFTKLGVSTRAELAAAHARRGE